MRIWKTLQIVSSTDTRKLFILQCRIDDESMTRVVTCSESQIPTAEEWDRMDEAR